MSTEKLLDLAVRAHGGLERWNRIRRFRAVATITGGIWDLKGRPGLLTEVELSGYTRDQWLAISPFPGEGRRAVWTPDRQSVQDLDGTIREERPDPLKSFAELTRESPWDELQVAYFASEANWNYFTTPFLFTRDDFTVEELAPWHEDGEVWRSLLVTYPDSIVTHTKQQTYYFDDTGLLRRIDYSVDILGGGPAVHYPSEYREFDGIMVPTRRRVYVRDERGIPDLTWLAIAIDVSAVSFA